MRRSRRNSKFARETQRRPRPASGYYNRSKSLNWRLCGCDDPLGAGVASVRSSWTSSSSRKYRTSESSASWSCWRNFGRLPPVFTRRARTTATEIPTATSKTATTPHTATVPMSHEDDDNVRLLEEGRSGTSDWSSPCSPSACPSTWKEKKR